MSQPDPDLHLSRQILSALADGEATEAEGADAKSTGAKKT